MRSNLPAYVNRSLLVRSFRNVGVHVAIERWAETVREMVPERYDSISSMKQIYLEILELSDEQIELFVEAMLRELPEKDWQRLLTIEAHECLNPKN